MAEEANSYLKNSTNVRSYNNALLLYSAPLSMFSAKVEIALREKQLAYAKQLVPFTLAEEYSPKHPAVLVHNPKAQVPVLIAGALALYDSTQIFEFLEDRFPEPNLWPRNVTGRALARQWEHWSDELLSATTLRLRDHGLGRDERQKLAHDVHAHLNRLEEHLTGRMYVAEDFSFADIALFLAEFFSVLFGLNRGDRPHIAARRERLLARAAVENVAAQMTEYAADAGIATAGSLIELEGMHDGA